ncbi:hypothetical protein [Chitinophaga sp.]
MKTLIVTLSLVIQLAIIPRATHVSLMTETDKLAHLINPFLAK